MSDNLTVSYLCFAFDNNPHVNINNNYCCRAKVAPTSFPLSRRGLIASAVRKSAGNPIGVEADVIRIAFITIILYMIQCFCMLL